VDTNENPKGVCLIQVSWYFWPSESSLSFANSFKMPFLAFLSGGANAVVIRLQACIRLQKVVIGQPHDYRPITIQMGTQSLKVVADKVASETNISSLATNISSVANIILYLATKSLA